MKTIWKENKDFRVFVWTIFNALVSFIGTQLAGLDGANAALITGMAVPLLNSITKYINTKYFNDLGVN